MLYKFAEKVEKHVHPASLPIKVKLLESEKDIPKKALRPKKDLDCQITPCHAWGLTCRQSLSIAMLKEDFNLDCGSALIIFGLIKPPKWWIEGNLAYGQFAGTREAAVNMEKSVFRFEPGKYIGLAFSPLRKTDFDPDMVMLYCNSVQAMLLVNAAIYEDGNPLDTTISARNVCSDTIVQTIQTGKCQVSIPCAGDHLHGLAKDYEIIFSAPSHKLNSIMRGLDSVSRARAGDYKGETSIRLGKKSPVLMRYKKLREIIEENY